MVLHADEFGPAIPLGAKLHLGKLIGPHRASSNIANFARSNQVVKRRHSLLDGRISIKAVNLQEIDVVRAKAL